MKRIAIGIIALAFVALSVNLFAQGNAAAKPKLVVEQPTFQAGDVYRTPQRLEHAFIIKNTGTAELQILAAKPG
jgi:hypothetical protein